MKKWCSQMEAITHTTKTGICVMLWATVVSIIIRTTGTAMVYGTIRITGTATMERSIITRTTGTATVDGTISPMVTTVVHAV